VNLAGRIFCCEERVDDDLHADDIRLMAIDLGVEDAAPRDRTADLPIDIFQFEEIPYSLLVRLCRKTESMTWHCGDSSVDEGYLRKVEAEASLDDKSRKWMQLNTKRFGACAQDHQSWSVGAKLSHRHDCGNC